METRIGGMDVALLPAGTGTALLTFLLPLAVMSAEKADAPASPFPIDLVVESLQVGPRGTETIGSDEARVLPGRGASLDREFTLSGRTSRGGQATEKVRIQAEIRVNRVEPARLALSVRWRVSVLAATGGISIPNAPVIQSAVRELTAGSSQILEVYESPALRVKIALNVRWSPAEEGDAEGQGRIPVPLVARLYDVGDAGAVLINENRPSAPVGGTAAATFSRNVSLPAGKEGGKRFRQERVEVLLSPRFLVGQELSLSIELTGDIVTREAEGSVSHPLAHQGNYLLAPGVPATFDLEAVAGEGGVEGWTRLRLRLEVAAF